jgi:hypothetical protein
MRLPARVVMVCLSLGLILGLAQAADAQGARMLRDPDVGPNHIVFVHANDLWLTGRDGGDALRLLETEAVTLMAEPAAPIRWRRPERW